MELKHKKKYLGYLKDIAHPGDDTLWNAKDYRVVKGHALSRAAKSSVEKKQHHAMDQRVSVERKRLMKQYKEES